MLILKDIEVANINELQINLYKNKSATELEKYIEVWKTKTVNGKYFEMLGIFNEKTLVGIFSLAEHTNSSVSLGIEIFENYRKLGYGYNALRLGLEKAREKGFKMTVNQVRTDNQASLALCKKCGLETDFYEYANKKGNKVYLLVKSL